MSTQRVAIVGDPSLADGRTERNVGTGDPVDLLPAGPVETLAIPESGSFF